MAVEPGTRLGPYEISTQLGVGGMGEVYRATDSNLGRQVAVKVLPAAFALDADRMARFDREARTLASLNHTNIAHVYGFERGNGLTGLVMELVEGPTLADRIAAGAMPIDEALPVARQIAEALEAAHEQGVIHRDLKPANIKLRPDGTVKVLDFGLAKAVDPVTSISSVSAPTITTPAMTQMGVILGTAAYMSPEQARGKNVDKRSDIWAFGCVLYEMLTGKRAFSGDETTDVLARVIERDVDFSLVPASVPPSIRRLLRRCLEKERKNRLTDIGVARLDIDEVTSHPVEEIAAPPGQTLSNTSTFERIGWAEAVIAAAAIAGTIAYARRPAPTPVPEVKFEIPMGPMYQANDLAVSQDGRKIAYTSVSPEGRQSIMVRALDSTESTMVAGSTTASRQPLSPSWSPDGRFLAFIVDGTLKKVELAGGTPQVLAKVDGQPGGSTWNSDNVILFASNEHGIRSIGASGGALTEVTTRDEKLEELYHDGPQFLPDGKRFLYVAWSMSKPESRAIYAGALGTNERTRIMDAESNALYAKGNLFYQQGNVLMMRPFDVNALKFTGDGVPVVQNVPKAGDEIGSFAVSESGALIYRSGVAQAVRRQLAWLDRTGKTVPVVDAMFATAAFRLSPDGTRIAYVDNEGPNADIWTYDLTRNVRTRLTTDPAADHNPIWSPDGSKIIFDSHRGGAGESALYEKPANGATPERQILEGEKGWEHAPRDWSSDGLTLVFTKSGPPDGLWNIWRLPLGGEQKPAPFRTGRFLESEAVLSSNGQWLAFTSNESGRDEVVVQSWPDASQGRWQISSEGGSAPRWRRDGRELFFVDARGRLNAVSVSTQGTFSILQNSVIAQTPFPLPLVQSGAGAPYDVAPDGQRFLMLVPQGRVTSLPLTVRLNWLNKQ
jgi:serine/threonine protein kinase/Tol biopolymer transport system component